MLVPLNKETTAILVSRINPERVKFYLYANFPFSFGWKTWQLISWVKISNNNVSVYSI